MSIYVVTRDDTTKNPERLISRGSWHIVTLCDMLIWWSRRESNPRPEILYEEFYILSQVNLSFNL